MKRAFDFVLALVLIACMSPFLLLIGISVSVCSGFPVLYKQTRVGLGFRPFNIYKFRTMRVRQEGNILQITAGGDDRVTGVGRILRRLKLDELPQLFNVLKGDMSFVGPRPEVPKYVEMFRREYEELLRVRPGITDWSSVRYRHEESVLGAQDDPEEYYVKVLLPLKIRLSAEYVRNRGFVTDVKILYETAKAVLTI